MTAAAQDRALVVGEALIDEVVRPDGSRERHPGGSPANVAIGLGRLGRSVDLLTWLGDDADGDLVRRHLTDSHVHVLTGDRRASRTPVATANIDAAGVASYQFDLEWDLPSTWDDADGDPLVVHTGSIATVLQPGGTAVEQLIARSRPTSTITYDPNLRPVLMGSPANALPVVDALVRLADVVKVSDEDLAWLHPGVAPGRDRRGVEPLRAVARRRHARRRGCVRQHVGGRAPAGRRAEGAGRGHRRRGRLVHGRTHRRPVVRRPARRRQPAGAGRRRHRRAPARARALRADRRDHRLARGREPAARGRAGLTRPAGARRTPGSGYARRSRAWARAREALRSASFSSSILRASSAFQVRFSPDSGSKIMARAGSNHSGAWSPSRILLSESSATMSCVRRPSPSRSRSSSSSLPATSGLVSNGM